LPSGIQALPADLTRPETLRASPAGLDFVFYTAAADGSNDEAYRAAYVQGLRNLLEALQVQNQRPHRVCFTSSTAVYAQSSGEWVDEGSPTEPVHFSGRRLREAERLLLGGRFPAAWRESTVQVAHG
jgi:nucleoside-diphosphate-sugar epimerase